MTPSKVTGDLQRSGIKRSRLESPGQIFFNQPLFQKNARKKIVRYLRKRNAIESNNSRENRQFRNPHWMFTDVPPKKKDHSKKNKTFPLPPTFSNQAPTNINLKNNCILSFPKEIPRKKSGKTNFSPPKTH